MEKQDDQTHADDASRQWRILIGRALGSSFCQVFECNEFVVTIGKTGNEGFKRAVPLSHIEIGYDTTHECLELQEN